MTYKKWKLQSLFPIYFPFRYLIQYKEGYFVASNHSYHVSFCLMKKALK